MDDYWHGEVVVASKPRWGFLFSDYSQLIISFSLPYFALMKKLRFVVWHSKLYIE